MVDPELTFILERVYEKTKRKSFLTNYFAAYFVEISEIIFQLNRELKLASYKIKKDITVKEKLFSVFKDIIKKTFSYKNSIAFTSIPEEPKFIFVVEYSSHFKEFSSLHQKMLNINIPHLTVFINNTTFDKYQKYSGNSILINSNRNLLQHLSMLFKFWMVNISFIGNGFLKYFPGVSKSKLYLELLYLNTKTLIENLNLLKNFERVIKRYPNIPVIFFKSEGFRTRSLILKSKSFGNKVVSIQHGSIHVEAKNFKFPTDLYIVWSEIFREMLIKSKSDCNIEVLGRAGFDEVFNHKHLLKPRLLDKKRVKILFLPNSGGSQTPYSEVLFALDTCLQASLKNPEIELHIKPHPSDTSDRIQNELLKLNSNALFHPNTEKANYNEYDIIATMNSNSGLEAAVFGIPLIILVSNVEMLMVKEYLDYKIAELATSATEFAKSCELIANNYQYYQHNTKIFIDEYLANQGTASEKIIHRLIQFYSDQQTKN